MNVGRRGFLGGMASLGALGGCRSLGTLSAFDSPKLRFGVVSDVHVTTLESVAEFVGALEYFRDRKADAVVVCGDLTDWGLLSGLEYFAAAWRGVFPGNRAPDGRKVTPLFVSGNHDYEGWWYGDMTMEMHACGYSEDEALVKLGFKKCWEETFQEAWAPVRKRTVNGFDFISGEWHGYDKQAGFDTAPAWFAAHGSELDPSKPFFYFQHPPIANTTGDSIRKNGGTYPFMDVRKMLDAHANAVSFTGHCHWTFNDSRSIWQDGFTAIATPSMSYTTIPAGYENGSGKRDGSCALAMDKIPSRPNLEEAQGYFVSVYDGRMEVERRDFECGCDMAPWIVPLPIAREKPFEFKKSASRERVPEFPADAKLATYTRNGETRQGKWAILQVLDFPAAAGRNYRAFDYEVRVVLQNAQVALTKCFLSPAFHKPAGAEPAAMSFRFNVDELPQDVPYRFEIYPRNCFGAAGKPLVSTVRRGKPGLGKAKRG